MSCKLRLKVFNSEGAVVDAEIPAPVVEEVIRDPLNSEQSLLFVSLRKFGEFKEVIGDIGLRSGVAIVSPQPYEEVRRELDANTYG